MRNWIPQHLRVLNGRRSLWCFSAIGLSEINRSSTIQCCLLTSPIRLSRPTTMDYQGWDHNCPCWSWEVCSYSTKSLQSRLLNAWSRLVAGRKMLIWKSTKTLEHTSSALPPGKASAGLHRLCIGKISLALKRLTTAASKSCVQSIAKTKPWSLPSTTKCLATTSTWRCTSSHQSKYVILPKRSCFPTNLNVFCTPGTCTRMPTSMTCLEER